MDYDIQVKELFPSIGELKYFARVLFYLKGGKTTNNGIDEVHGKTREETKGKMEEKVEEWLIKRS